MGKLFSDFRISLTEDINYGLKDLVYFNQDALKESMDEVENYRQRHFKDGWQNIEVAPPPENASNTVRSSSWYCLLPSFFSEYLSFSLNFQKVNRLCQH